MPLMHIVYSFLTLDNNYTFTDNDTKTFPTASGEWLLVMFGNLSAVVGASYCVSNLAQFFFCKGDHSSLPLRPGAFQDWHAVN